MRVNVLLIILSIFTMVLVSCGKDDVDTTKPVIKLNNLADETAFQPGDTIQFECVFSDNVELLSYKVDIHGVSDEHEHEYKSLEVVPKSLLLEEEGHEWSFEKSWEFEKGQQQVSVSHKEIVIPETIMEGQIEEPILPGHYHFGVFCADVAGNENFVFVEIKIGL
jgi:hypothetical protein